MSTPIVAPPVLSKRKSASTVVGPKSCGRRSRTGPLPPLPVRKRTQATAAGLLNSIGLDNDGIDAFIAHHLPYLRQIGTRVIASIAGREPADYVAMACQLQEAGGVDALCRLTFNGFSLVFLLTGGGPSNDTEVFPLLTYHLALQNFRLGEGAAVPILMLPIIALLVFGVASYMDREATQ